MNVRELDTSQDSAQWNGLGALLDLRSVKGWDLAGQSDLSDVLINRASCNVHGVAAGPGSTAR